MDLELLGYFISIIIGVSIGLLGGGGAILAVPMLVYFFGVAPEKATGYSLVIVALSSLISYWQKKDLGKLYPSVILKFGIPSVVLIYLTKSIFVPLIPNLIVFSPKVILTKDMLLMTIFAIVLFFSSISLLGKSNSNESNETVIPNTFNLLLYGAFVGFLTGLIGVGGAFLIVPAFISLVGMETKEAIKNSLVIVIFNAIFGFYGFYKVTPIIDTKLILIIAIISTLGVFLGNYLNKKLSNEKIKHIFGWMNLILSFILILKEVIFRIYTYKDLIK